jgi:hypothetical protein
MQKPGLAAGLFASGMRRLAGGVAPYLMHAEAQKTLSPLIVHLRSLNLLANKKSIPARKTSLIFSAALFIEGVVLSGVGARCGRRQCGCGGAPGGAAAYVTGRAHPASGGPR